ncbi:MAG: S-layer homology domain-containing protein [Clostridia bacterium]|nr:S-layer homology domain-containing protein [Clostridia bacterium]
MIKKITALVLALAFALSVSSLPTFAATYADVDASSEMGTAVEVLSALDVLSGYGDGNFHPDDSLTRAQFAKIAVYLLGKADEAVTRTDAFSDVSSSDWYSNFVSVVASEGIIEGYPDGSFGANDEITYAQALTILIRLLGYTAEDVGYKWPQGYIDKAAALKITEGVTFDSDDVITRGVAALFIYRALFTDMKSGAQLVTNMDVEVYEDTVITATREENSALLENEIQTSAGTFKKGALDLDFEVGYEGTVVVNDDSEIVAFMQNENMSSESYVTTRVYTETNSTNVAILTDSGDTLYYDVETPVYKNGSKTTAADLVGITEGSTLTMFYKGSVLQYILLNEYTLQGPKTVESTSTVSSLFSYSDLSTLKVIRKGITASLSDIEQYDVCYYSEKTNTLYAYNDRVTGVYEDASPIKANVSTVTVSGKEYTLGSSTAISKMNESEGAFKIGDRVTLLLGTDGEVVDVVDLTSADISIYGVVIGTEERISEDDDKKGRAEYYVNILMADGSEMSYLTDTDDYEEKAGKFCEVDFENSYAKLTFPKSVTITGKVDKDTKTVGGVALASDYSILEYEDGDDYDAAVSKITLADLDGITLRAAKVKHVVYNAKGEILVLYVDNVSGNRNTYGMMIEVPDDNDGTYTMLVNGVTTTFSGTYNSFSAGDAVSYYSGISGVEVKQLTRVATGTSINGYTDNIIKMNGQSYLMADDVAVYAGAYAGEFKSVSLDDALSLAGTIVFYANASISEGGKVRIIKIITG